MKNEKQTDEKLNQWNFIIKENGLKMNVEKAVTAGISRNLQHKRQNKY
jgi:hypothetical protein